MSRKNKSNFLRASGIRALRSFIQGFIVALPFTVTEASVNNWGELGHDILMALANATAYALVSFLTSVLTGLPEVETISQGEPKDAQKVAESTTDETKK